MIINKLLLKPIIFTSNINKQDNDTYKVDNLYRKDLLEINNTVCPCCGSKIVSVSKFQELMKAAEKLNNAADLENFLLENKNLIPDSHKKLLLNSVNYVKNRFGNPPIDFTLRKIRGNGVQKIEKSIIYAQENLLAEAEMGSLPDEKIISLENTANYMDLILKEGRHNIIKFRYSTYAKEISNFLELDFPESHSDRAAELKQICYDNVENAFKTRELYDYNSRINTIPELIVGKLLSVQRPYTVCISDHENDFSNRIPICSQCVYNNKRPYGFTPYIKVQQIENFKKFINDISLGIANGTNSIFYKYPQQLIGCISGLTRGAINMTKRDLPPELKNFIFNTVKIDFPVTKLNKVPCASCGIETITHEEKDYIHEVIFNAKSPIDVIKIFKNYSGNSIHPKYLPIVEAIHSCENNKNLDWKTFLDTIEHCGNRDYNITIRRTTKKLNDLLKFTKSYEDFTTLQNLSNNILLLTKSKDVSIENVSRLIDNVRFQNNGTSHRVYRITHSRDFWYALNRCDMLNFSFNSEKRDISPELKMKRLIVNILSESVATVDHMEARALGGKDELGNLVVMCRECNVRKSDKRMHLWLKYMPEMPDNLAKYLKYIEEQRKLGNLEGFEDYSLKVIENFYRAKNSQPIDYQNPNTSK